MQPDLSTTLCDIYLNTPIYNASGPRCTTAVELWELNKSNSSAILTKSCTLTSRIGNPEPRYYGFSSENGDVFSINSMGIPNRGYEFYNMYAQGVNLQKPYIMSVSGLSVQDNLDILRSVKDNEKISAIELNISCPNIVGKPQLGYDFEGMEETLRKVSELWDVNKPLGLKLPPYLDIVHFQSASDIIRNSCVKFITCCNSLGNGLWIDSDTETAVIKPKTGFGGIGGSIMKPTTLANVHKFYQLLGDRVDVVGCGGVTSGQDVFDLILCGAKAVQIGTHFMENGHSVFDQCNSELWDIMMQKRYLQLSDFRGKLKYL